MYKTLSRIGFTRSNTILADSSCADELNHDDTQQDITSLFRDRWGEVCLFCQAMPALSPSSGAELPWQQAAAVRSHDVRSRLLAFYRCSTWEASAVCRSPAKQDGGRSAATFQRCGVAARVIMFRRAHQTTVNSCVCSNAQFAPLRRVETSLSCSHRTWAWIKRESSENVIEQDRLPHPHRAAHLLVRHRITTSITNYTYISM